MLLRQINVQTWQHTGMLCPAGSSCTPRRERSAHFPAKGRRIAAVGTPLCLTELDSGVLAALEAEGEQVLRSPLSEALWFLWKDNLDENKPSAGWLDQMQRQMQTLGNELGAHSAFAEDAETLFLIADSALPNFFRRERSISVRQGRGAF